MTESTTIVAFDQHAATTVAGVLLPGQRTPVIHSLTSDVTAIGRFVERSGPMWVRIAAILDGAPGPV